jgi:UDP-GlcNAc:undecaprenyl-phosphate GlcNAc-1-phosphate transferase
MVIEAVAFFAAVLAAVEVTPLLVKTAVRVDILDQPGGRKQHPMAVPRLGGVAIAIGLTAALGATIVAEVLVEGTAVDLSPLLPILAGSLLVFAVGLWDDIDPRTPGFKMAVELLACVIVIGAGIVISRVTFFGTTYDLGWGGPVLTTLWILVITNAFNLLDGLDGLAGGLIAIAAATCAVVLLARGDTAGARVLVALVGAVIGFLVFNLYPARIFLGDSGSLLAGFLLAVTAITGQQKEATTLVAAVPLTIFALPLLETAATITRRFYSGQRDSAPGLVSRLRAIKAVVSPDSGHLHYRLRQAGLPPLTTVLLLYLVACLCSVVALLTMEAP